MSDLRLKVRSKIYSYTSGSGMIDTSCNSNAIVVFLGKASSDALKMYTGGFLRDTLKAQIPMEKLMCVEIAKEQMNNLPAILCNAVKRVRFNPATGNKLYISFVTLMDDDFHSQSYNIDVTVLEQLKKSALGGFLVDITYDFYGFFASVANYENRKNAKQTIINFLHPGNGGVYVRKRIFHQACTGNDYYRVAKSLAFMILGNLIGRIDAQKLVDSKTDGVKYDWNTFALYEKNLAALVVYEMINKLLANQLGDYESVHMTDMDDIINSELNKLEMSLKGVISMDDYNYMPIALTRREVQLPGLIDRMMKKTKVEFREENVQLSINALLEQQKAVALAHVKSVVTFDYIKNFIDRMICACSTVSSINNKDTALVIGSLRRTKAELENKVKNIHPNSPYNEMYIKMISELKLIVITKIIEFYENNVENIRNRIRTYWNNVNGEVHALINDFAQFQEHFEGLSALVDDKYIKLLSNHDDILEIIDIKSVVDTINQDKGIYSKVLASYFDTVKSAGDIAIRFGNCNISPDLNHVAYTLFTPTEVRCPDSMFSVVDDYWFMEHEIAILLTVKNRPGDCENLPFG